MILTGRIKEKMYVRKNIFNMDWILWGKKACGIFLIVSPIVLL
jgi:hypothetical protein